MKRVIVTGASSGIGQEIVAQLAGAECSVVLACRDLTKANATVAEVRKRVPAAELSVMQVDTSSQASVRDFARRFKAEHDRLDVLINNAGANVRHKQLSADGVELTFATNVLGYHLLTHELMDLLERSGPARIVNVASEFAHHLDLDDLQFVRRRYEPVNAYAQSKACNRMLTWALARRLVGKSVTVNAMTPGFVRTGLYRDVAPRVRVILTIVGWLRGRSVAQGADTATWLATSAEVATTSGRFFNLRKDTPCDFRNEANEERLWATCNALTGLT